jgi:serine phosphatase RsbU (regulator of sigma subunit)
MCKYILIALFLVIAVANVSAQDEQSEKLKLKLQTANQKEKVSLYLKLADLADKNTDRVEYCERAINIANELKDVELQANSYFTLGIYHYTEGNYMDADRSFNESLGFYKKRNDTKSVAKAYYWLATTNRYWGKFNNAIGYAKLCLDLNERTKSPEGIIDANLIYGNIYQTWGDQNQAEVYYNKVLEQSKKKDETLAYGMALLGKGNVCFTRGNIDSAKTFYDNSKQIFVKINSKFGQAMSLREIARYYIFKKDYKKAEADINQSLGILKDINNKRGIYELYILKGDLYFKKAQHSRAVELYLSGQKIATQMGLSEEIAENYRTLSKLYETKKDNAKALKYYKSYAYIKDSIADINSSEQLLQILSSSDTEKKDKEQLLANTSKQLKSAERKNSIILIASIILGLSLIGGLAYVFLQGRKQMQISSLSSAEQQVKIDNYKSELDQNLEYAGKIQASILPDNSKLELEHFIMNRPCEQVSGDFYWFKRIGNQIIVAVADCTGHNVQGSLMTTLGISMLNVLTADKKVFDCAQMLEDIRGKVKMTLKQDIFDDKFIDVIDMALCIINTDTLKMQFSGANMSLLWITNNELRTLKGTNNPLGAYLKEKPFEEQEVQLKKGDNIYMFTNGYMDQFGGKEGKKFKLTHFKDALMAIYPGDMDTQKELLEKIFDEWKNSKYEQTDDVLVMGIKI